MHVYENRHQKTAREMLMDRDPDYHFIVELVGGPLDGRRFREVEARISHDKRDRYLFDGHCYRPDRTAWGKLYMAYVPQRKDGSLDVPKA
jgi:hypothetical protein